MNGAPETDSFEQSLPTGGENWSLDRKQDYMNGKPMPDSQGEMQSSDLTDQKPPDADSFDIPGEPIKYPTIQPNAAPSMESLSGGVKKRAKGWYGRQTDLTRSMLFQAFTDAAGEGAVTEERRGDLVRRSVGSIPPGSSAAILTNLTGEKPLEPVAVTEEAATEDVTADFNQNRMPARKGFDPSVTQVFPSVSVPDSAPESPKTSGPEGMFRDPSVLIHTVKEGDSVWNILEGALEK